MSVVLQEKGSFQLSFAFSELQSFKVAARSVKLNGYYRIRMLGVQVSTKQYLTPDFTPPQLLDAWAIQFYSPQMLQAITPDSQGFIVHLNKYDTINGAKHNADYLVKGDYIVGRPTEIVSVCQLQNVFEFQAALSTGSITGDAPHTKLVFDQPWQALYKDAQTGLPLDGIITFTFEYEEAKRYLF
jgi:hypothetical protein